MVWSMWIRLLCFKIFCSICFIHQFFMKRLAFLHLAVCKSGVVLLLIVESLQSHTWMFTCKVATLCGFIKVFTDRGVFESTWCLLRWLHETHSILLGRLCPLTLRRITHDLVYLSAAWLIAENARWNFSQSCLGTRFDICFGSLMCLKSEFAWGHYAHDCFITISQIFGTSFDI